MIADALSGIESITTTATIDYEKLCEAQQSDDELKQLCSIGPDIAGKISSANLQFSSWS